MAERLGEELPVFCERCGYSLHGLSQTRCPHCAVLHFACPECGHHQPINTLRPAFQRMLGRLRAIGLAGVVFLKINFFFWCLFAWGGLGTEIAYSYEYDSRRMGNAQFRPAQFEIEGGIIVFLLALAFAMVGRMLLLRWRKGAFVGFTLGVLVLTALILGAYFRQWGSTREFPSPLAPGFLTYLLCAIAGATVGGAFVWGLWQALAHTFLPKRIAGSLIEWQLAMSDPANNRKDAAMSVTS